MGNSREEQKAFCWTPLSSTKPCAAPLNGSCASAPGCRSLVRQLFQPNKPGNWTRSRRLPCIQRLCEGHSEWESFMTVKILKMRESIKWSRKIFGVDKIFKTYSTRKISIQTNTQCSLSIVLPAEASAWESEVGMSNVWAAWYSVDPDSETNIYISTHGDNILRRLSTCKCVAEHSSVHF